jgi:DNA-3-methyladenine glycosylase
MPPRLRAKTVSSGTVPAKKSSSETDLTKLSAPLRPPLKAMDFKLLDRAFYARPAVTVARALLGKVLTHGSAFGRIVETEAYLGVDDAAAHSARGITPRTRVIFGPPGFAYIYFIYGMYYCLNIVAESEGSAGCVLIRALEPLSGMSQASNGPGKLTRAMGITLEQNGSDLVDGPIAVFRPLRAERFEIATSPRIGITKSPDLPLRFYIAGNRFVSKMSSRMKTK